MPKQKKGGYPAHIEKAAGKAFVEKLVQASPDKADVIREIFERPISVPFNVRVPENELADFRHECERRGWSQTHAIRFLMKVLKRLPTGLE